MASKDKKNSESRWQNNIKALWERFESDWKKNDRKFFELAGKEDARCKALKCTLDPEAAKRNFEIIIDRISAIELLWGQLLYHDFSDTFYGEIKALFPDEFKGGMAFKKKWPINERVAFLERSNEVKKIVEEMKTFFRRSSRFNKDFYWFNSKKIILEINAYRSKNHMKNKFSPDAFYKRVERYGIIKNGRKYGCEKETLLKAFPELTKINFRLDELFPERSTPLKT